MQHIYKHLATTGCLLALVACGGGGMSATNPIMPVTTPSDEIPWWVDAEEFRTLTGEPAPPSDLDSEAIGSTVLQRAVAADSLLLSVFQTWTRDENGQGNRETIDDWNCSGKTCMGTYSGNTVEVTIGRRDKAPTPFMAAFQPGGVDSENVVFEAQALTADGESALYQAYDLGNARVRPGTEPVDIGMWLYGGWGEYNYFLVEGGGHEVSEDVYSFSYTGTLSAGVASKSNPATGSGTWNGIMIGSNVAEEGQAIHGDAEITIAAFTNPMVNVAFTGIQELIPPENDGEMTTSKPRDDMTWSDISLTDGVFKDEDPTTGSIEGQFYGPEHQEVGGVFLRDGIQGAFSGGR